MNPPATVVVLGTGTAVGKTYVTAALARALRAVTPDRPVAALKPIESGVPVPSPDQTTPPPGTDAAALAAASSAQTFPTPNPLYALPDPVSPHLAASRQNRSIDLNAVGSWASLLPYNTLRVVESAGGALTPLDLEPHTNLDLAKLFEPAVWLLVAPDALGVLHDVTATLTAMRALARPPDYLVLTASRPPDASTGTNAAELRRLGLADPIVLPRDDPAPLHSFASRLL